MLLILVLAESAVCCHTPESESAAGSRAGRGDEEAFLRGQSRVGNLVPTSAGLTFSFPRASSTPMSQERCCLPVVLMGGGFLQLCIHLICL